MVQDLKQYLQGHSCRGFNPVPHYFPDGDFVTYYFREDRCFAQRVDDLLTVFLAEETRELVGCKIKGVQHILKTAGTFGVSVKDGPVRLGLLFFVGAAWAQNEGQRQRYAELGRVAQNVDLDPRQLLPN